MNWELSVGFYPGIIIGFENSPIFLENSYSTPYEFFQSFENFVENSYGTPYDFS